MCSTVSVEWPVVAYSSIAKAKLDTSGLTAIDHRNVEVAIQSFLSNQHY